MPPQTTAQPNFNDFVKGLGVSSTPSQPQTPSWSSKLQSLYQPTTDVSQETPSTKNLGDYSAEAITGGVNKIKSSITGGADKISAGMNQGGLGGLGKIAVGAGESALGTASGFLQTIFSPLTASINDAADHISNNPIVQKISQSGFGDAIAKGEQGFNDWAAKHPELATNLSDALNVGMAALGDKLAGSPDIGLPDTTTLKSDLANIKNGITDTTGKISDIIGGAKDKIVDTASNVKNNITGTPKNDLQTLNEKITPAPTKNQAQLALEQGRLYKGSDPTLLKSGTPDQIATPDAQARQVQTINRLIPDHAQMDEPTLYDAMNKKITETSTTLKPQMEATPIKPETIDKINTDWENLKKTQMQDAKATDEPNVQKWQNNFEKFLKKSGNENMNDLWDARKNYDASIKPNVKNANINSPEDLQTQKEIWQQNRTILNNAINDSKVGMGATSQQAFSDMSDMYEAKNSISSKAKVSTEGKPSKLSSAYNSKTGKIIRAGLSVEGAKKVLTGGF